VENAARGMWVASVTRAMWRMPSRFSCSPMRAAAAFRAVGFEVLPAPTGFVTAAERPLLQWFPSTTGVADCRALIREWLGRAVMRAG